ncbi:hypothetical protein FCR2A7T_16240 [Flavobacterium cauense R2A-7]|nr:hypothetical protein FCR2A7T_16240 [Flavobacterium cauense R2A-7]
MKRMVQAFLESVFPLSASILFALKERAKRISAAIGAIEFASGIFGYYI